MEDAHRENKDYFIKYIEKIKEIWEKRDVLIVEGSRTRMGIGNDLFINAKTIRRIICPDKNAFQKYDEILNKVLKHTERNDLVLCAMGPTATVLAYDLAKKGIQALDLGHIDIEYEWFLRGLTTNDRIPGKEFSEASNEFLDDPEMKVYGIVEIIE